MITEKEIKELAIKAYGNDFVRGEGYIAGYKQRLWEEAALQNKVSDVPENMEQWASYFVEKADYIRNNIGFGLRFNRADLLDVLIDSFVDIASKVQKDTRKEYAFIVNERKNNAGVWVKASDRLPGVIDKKCTPVFIRAEIKGYGGKVYISKRVAFYFPDHFKTIEFEDWDDYNEDDYPYIENDQEKGVCWLRAGWYESVNCEKCEDYWNSPLNVIEWLDESRVQSNNVGVNDAIEFADWLRKNNMSHNGFGGWGGGKINVNFYGSKTTDLYKLFQESQTQKKVINHNKK